MSPAAFIDDPNWADFLPEIKEPARRSHLPTHEDCSRIDPEAAEAHLRAGGTLGRMAGYEERPGQLEMLKAIVRAFNAREHLMVEAGTGVGKSLAYVIPSILWAWTNDTPVVVSTATRNLQSQLMEADIPRAVQILGDDAQKFKVVLLKGRTNYLCLRAVADFFEAGYWTMSQEEQAEMPRFIAWLKSTPDGDLDSYDGLKSQQLFCPGEECGGRNCSYYSRCFVYRVRKAAAEAHLIVANHALVLAEATSEGGVILPAYGRLVLDEAHNLENTATDCLSCELSAPTLKHALNRLMRKTPGRRGRPAGVLASVNRQLQKGVLANTGAAQTLADLLNDASGLIVRTHQAAEDIFDLAEHLLGVARGDSVVRYKVSEGKRWFSVDSLFTECPKDLWNEAALLAAQKRLESALAALIHLLHEMRDTLDGATPPGELNYLADLSTQVNGVADTLINFANEAHFVLKGEKESYAYWVEKVRTERFPPYVRLVAAPLSVADALQGLLYDQKDSVILSSATLRVGNDFRYTARRLGCCSGPEGGRFRTFVAVSPFNYLTQSLVLAADCLPDPSVDSARYADALAALLKRLFGLTKGRALVLFTSYDMMNAVASAVRDELAESGIDLLVQGEGQSREAMTRTLRRTGTDGAPVVLFGAQSFWEGVDVAGEALSCVVIARLPFAWLKDPIVEARSAKIAREGGTPFREYALPEAVIKFRQGFGRLIRSKRDRGVVVVTDPRLVTKSYGASFRKSIPASVHTVTSLDELLSRVDAFFK